MYVVCVFTRPAQADDTLDAWASWALAPKVWKGQTVLAPDPEPDPLGGGPQLTLASMQLPVRMHVAPSSPERRALLSLGALERAYSLLSIYDWPLPGFDGELGGDAGLDVYAVPRARCGGTAACAGYAAPLAPSDFDAALTYGMVASDVSSAELAACVHSALAQAGLRAVDPAEADSWIYASAELSVWQLTGELGCDMSLGRGQHIAELGLLNASRESAFSGALFLGMLSERVERTAGSFVRSLWESTRQRSQGLVDPERLRSSPDLWEVLALVLESQHVKLEDELVEFGVARYFAGPAARKAQAPYRVLAALPSDAAVPITHDLRSPQLPVKLREHPPLHDLGSAYTRIRLEDQTAERMRIWLHGELGARWALTAVRLNASGRELGRVSAPARKVPNAYLPVSLDAETAEVVLVVTQLPNRTPDADLQLDTSHGYELIVDVSEPSSASRSD